MFKIVIIIIDKGQQLAVSWQIVYNQYNMNAALYKAFKHIIYRDIDHTYTCLKTGNQLTSMTTYKKRWEPEFDDTWADRKAPIYGTDAKRVKEFWGHEAWLAKEKGTLLHGFLELLFQRKIIYPEIPKYLNQADVQKLFKMATDYFKTVEEAVVALEIVMGNEIVGGTADKLLEGQSGLVLRDFKTGKIKSSRDMLKTPYEYLQAGTIGSWTLQLNGYRDMLESNGFPVEKMEIAYFNEDNDSAKIYPIERINFIW